MRVVVTGANRGIGLEFARQFAARGDRVEAAARDLSGAHQLVALAGQYPQLVQPGTCDVCDDASVAAFAASLGEEPVDVLVNNAGVMGERTSLEGVGMGDALRAFDTNALGPVRVTRALLSRLRAGAGRKIAHVSSGMGSIGDNNSGGAYAYRMSKAALNMASKCMAVELRSEGIVSVVFNPGWVQSDMGGAHAPTPVDQSVAAMIRLIDALTPAQSGAFIDYRGHTLEW